ncbi:MAG: Mrp/NBP35 family ATP-binding protein [Eubacteriales bacterium]|jgi:Mrp family chromosome partitioning ATPase|nr:Mrp/NBP35 family ATP-binding protein [Eubacteriales bacterium]MDD3109421.1 Mrp/NBP35 family ATP-binding protein [Eubacteriales bacterium]MDD3572391.1 Mrp/NBP35 family ATP-binding protein [Eubacteriales bacterium]MDD4134391.1 Mrp/NBP35 family ATP-binding protein [Eubacteriales bacterium]NLO13732.1 Mrp/NBP35 family ATP-binding protein [Clostridiales bacterium]
MSENCDNNCGSCSQNCEDRKAPQDLKAHLSPESRVSRVIGVVSGKGGVGKSLVTSLLAVCANRLGMRTAILDADITGPSIPRAFGIRGKALGDQSHILPIFSRDGVQIISVNLLLENDSDPVIWRGPILAGTVKQFYSDVLWHEVDVMFIDMPPGTGDVPLTVFQSLPLDGVIVVTSPQELVGMIVGKAVKMARMMKVPILGVVENMSYFLCPDNGKEYKIFGGNGALEAAEEFGLPLLARLPIDPEISLACDQGRIEDIKGGWLMPAAKMIGEIGGGAA